MLDDDVKDIYIKNLQSAIRQCTGNMANGNRYCWVNANFYEGIPLSSCQEPTKVEKEFKYICKLARR